MHTYNGIGLMSGTSCDGLDICFSRFTQENGSWNGQIEHAETKAYSTEWQERLRTAHALSGEALAKLHTDFGHYQALLLRQVLVEQQLSPQWVCAHGHTIFHQPKDAHFTLQIGDGETLVSYLDCPLVTNMRMRDVAQGGEGAPLVPFGEQVLFQEKLFLNLGGIANLSAFSPESGSWILFTQRGPKPYVAYDIAPCNLVLNEVLSWMQPDLSFDDKGRIASAGSLIPELLDQLNRLAFYYLPPPRSLGSEFVQQQVLPLLAPYRDRAADVLHTWTKHLAERLAAECDRYQISNEQMLVSGGGAHNDFLVGCLGEVLAPMSITVEKAGEQMVDFKEAHIFAWLGLNTLLRVPNVMPEVTGARQAVIGGGIHLPDSWSKPLI